MKYRGKRAEAARAFLEAATGVDASVCEDEDTQGVFFEPGRFALHAVLTARRTRTMSEKTIRAVGYLKAPTDGDVGRLAQAIRDCAEEHGLALTGIHVDKPARPNNHGSASAEFALRVRGVDVLISSTPEAAKKAISPGLIFEFLDASQAPAPPPPADETPAEGVDENG
jgi:hypothetical protein